MFDTFEERLKKLEEDIAKSEKFIPSPAGTFLLESGQQIAVQMQFRLFSFALIVLNCMEYSNCQAPSQRWRRSKRGNAGLEPTGLTAASINRWLESLCGSREATVLSLKQGFLTS